MDIELVKRPVAQPVSRFSVQKKRWIVGRTLGWLGLSRRHIQDYKLNLEKSDTLIEISMIQLMLKRLETS